MQVGTVTSQPHQTGRSQVRPGGWRTSHPGSPVLPPARSQENPPPAHFRGAGGHVERQLRKPDSLSDASL